MLAFTGKRKRGKYFKDRGSYLLERAGGVREPQLCHAIVDAGKPLGPGVVTPVLGSGCLEPLDADDWAVMRQLPKTVVAHLEGYPEADAWFDGDSSGALRRFVESLVEDRVDPKYLAQATDARAPDVSSTAAKIVLLAALVTRLFHMMKASDVTALTRSGDEVATMDRGSVWWPSLEQKLADPAVRLAEMLQCELDDDPVSVLVKEISEAITKTIKPAGLAPAQVMLWHVTLLTECGWYFLTQGTSVYPGWSDLLLTLAVQSRRPHRLETKELALHAGGGIQMLRTGIPRPEFEHLRLAADAIKEVFVPPTKVSWSRASAGALSDRSRLYSACAELLNVQAAAAKTSGPLPLPVASAFVTTFDLELEMALLRAARSPFLVAVPFHVLVGSMKEREEVQSHPAWLAYVVRPHDSLDYLMEPTEWVVLHDGLFPVASIPRERGQKAAVLDHESTDLRYATLPVVVRLSGSPLVRPPSLYDAMTKQWGALVGDLKSVLGTTFASLDEPSDDTSGPGMVLEHAVVIDEYASMQQTAAELFTPNAGRVGLPNALSGNTDARGRFWMLLGVQVGDPGMRHRVAFQMSAPALTDTHRVQPPGRPGIVVNRRLSYEDQELLHWFGFDVVHGRCQDFVQDLERVVLHHPDGMWWHSVDDECV